MVDMFWTAMNTKAHLHLHPACAAASGGAGGEENHWPCTA
jgi:hypothetical protein